MKDYMTSQRKHLLQYLFAHSEKPASAEEIASAMNSVYPISASAVYRNLAKLTQSGVVRKFVSQDERTALYQYFGNNDCEKHLHLKCTVCGKVFHMEDNDSEKLLKSVLKHSDFSVDEKSTVLYGTCHTCK